MSSAGLRGGVNRILFSLLSVPYSPSSVFIGFCDGLGKANELCNLLLSSLSYTIAYYTYNIIPIWHGVRLPCGTPFWSSTLLMVRSSRGIDYAVIASVAFELITLCG